MKLVFSSEASLCEAAPYPPGELPARVQRWEPPCEKADLLVFPTHADDDALYFGALISYCTKYLGWAVQTENERHPEFAEDARPLRFTGEMFYPWMFEEIRLLQPFGPAVHVLQERTDWPARYDHARLAANEVPVAAAVYFDDLYVDADLQLQTAGEIANLTTWVTDE